MPKIRAIVLAAGLSRRMNGLNKLLLPHGEATVIRAVVDALRQCPVDIVVVTGRDADLVAAEVAPSRTVFNENFVQGMGTSISAGIYGSGEQPDAYLIVLGDMPDLSPLVIQALVRHGTPDRIVVPIYADEPERFGHPVCFGRGFAEELSALDGDEGARKILELHSDRITRVQVPGRLVDRDS